MKPTRSIFFDNEMWSDTVKQIFCFVLFFCFPKNAKVKVQYENLNEMGAYNIASSIGSKTKQFFVNFSYILNQVQISHLQKITKSNFGFYLYCGCKRVD